MTRNIQKTILLSLLLWSCPLADLIYGAYYSPGIKIGFQLGKNGGTILAFENSLTGAFFLGTPFAGIVGGIGIDINRSKFIGYWEIEAGFTPLGIALGGQWNSGYYHSIRVFGGAMAFLSYKHLFKSNMNEIALVGKLPYGFYEVMDHGTYIFGKEVRHSD
jgi:hypothetical protein